MPRASPSKKHPLPKQHPAYWHDRSLLPKTRRVDLPNGTSFFKKAAVTCQKDKVTADGTTVLVPQCAAKVAGPDNRRCARPVSAKRDHATSAYCTSHSMHPPVASGKYKTVMIKGKEVFIPDRA